MRRCARDAEPLDARMDQQEHAMRAISTFCPALLTVCAGAPAWYLCSCCCLAIRTAHVTVTWSGRPNCRTHISLHGPHTIFMVMTTYRYNVTLKQKSRDLASTQPLYQMRKIQM